MTKMAKCHEWSAYSEVETFWTDFLRSLADSGLRSVKLVIAPSRQI